jgi:hypothetical protein
MEVSSIGGGQARWPPAMAYQRRMLGKGTYRGNSSGMSGFARSIGPPARDQPKLPDPHHLYLAERIRWKQAERARHRKDRRRVMVFYSASGMEFTVSRRTERGKFGACS